MKSAVCRKGPLGRAPVMSGECTPWCPDRGLAMCAAQGETGPHCTLWHVAGAAGLRLAGHTAEAGPQIKVPGSTSPYRTRGSAGGGTRGTQVGPSFQFLLSVTPS